MSDNSSGPQQSDDAFSPAVPPLSQAGMTLGGGDDGNGEPSFPSVPGYEITARLGEGGMGVVWRATQLSTHREVALKLMSPGAFGSQHGQARFQREVELAASLEHPNIARIYDSGLREGAWCYAMELIEGRPLDEWVRERKLEPRAVLELMATVARAVQHAHMRGVIHRDLKPSNILVDEAGRPHVLDFGLAKTMAGERALAISMTGEMLGTPAYMSPEQAAGRIDGVDTRTDVYSLGVILYELVTGERPHDLQATRYEVLRRIAEDDVRRPRQMDGRVHPELEALLLKALAREPEQRYPSAGELADDIDNYLAGEPLTARRPTTLYFLRKRLRKHRVALTVAAAVLALLLGVAVAAYVRVSQERNRAEAEAQRAREQAARATAVSTFLTEMLRASSPTQSRGRDVTVRETLARAAKMADTELAGQPAVEAQIRTTLGETFLWLGDYASAERHLRRAVELGRLHLGADDERTLTAAGRLGLVLVRLERLDEADKLLADTRASAERALGADAPTTLMIAGATARLRAAAGQNDQAETVMCAVLAAQRRALGDGHRDTIESIRWLAGHTADPARAEQLADEAVRLCRDHFGPDDPRTLAALDGLAALMVARGEHASAESVLRQAWDASRRVNGPDHPDTLDLGHHLANALGRLDRGSEGVQLLRDTLHRSQRVLGLAHTATAAVLGDLVELLLADDRLQEALTYQQELVRALDKLHGEQDARTLRARSVVARLHRELRDFSRSAAVARPTLELQRQVLGADHPDTLITQARLADALMMLDQIDGTEELADAAYKGLREKLGIDNRETLTAMHIAAHAMRHCSPGHIHDTIPMREELLQHARTVFGERDPFTRRMWQWWINELHQHGRVTQEREERARFEEFFGGSPSTQPDVI